MLMTEWTPCFRKVCAFETPINKGGQTNGLALIRAYDDIMSRLRTEERRTYSCNGRS